MGTWGRLALCAPRVAAVFAAGLAVAASLIGALGRTGRLQLAFGMLLAVGLAVRF